MGSLSCGITFQFFNPSSSEKGSQRLELDQHFLHPLRADAYGHLPSSYLRRPQILRQLGRLGQFGAVHKNRHDRNAALDRRDNFETQHIVFVLQPAPTRGVFRVDPTFADQRKYNLTGRKLGLDRVAKI